MSYTPTRYNCGGLFAITDTDCNINNLKLTNLTISSSVANVGGLASYNKGTMINCSVDLSLLSTNSNPRIGGLVRLNTGTIKKCYTDVDIKYIDPTPTSFCAGGLVEYNTGNIENSYAVGIITSSFIGGNVTSSGLIRQCGYTITPKHVSNCYSAVIADNAGTFYGMVDSFYLSTIGY